MTISASIKNSLHKNEVTVSTNSQSKTVSIPSKESGYGSSVNGGELLLLALATCYCNDIYREAAKRNIQVTEVEVQVTGNFGAEGEPGSNFQYKPIVKSNASAEELRKLIEHTDSVAEIHNTLRRGTSVKLMY